MWTVVITSGLMFLASAVSETNFETEHILTVCDAFNIRHTRRGEAIPECPQLPSAKGFFHHLPQKLYEKQCDANATSSSSSESSLIERGVFILKRLVDSVKDGVVQLAVSLLAAVEDVSGLKSVGQRWNHRVYLILAGSCFLFFHLHRGKNPLTFNILLSFLTSGPFYFVHLYYRNWLVTWLLIAIAALVGSPLYSRTRRLTGLGAMTFIHLAIPLLDRVLRLVVEAQLFFGPVLSLVINVISILIHVICLIGLYIDEKLLIIKVLFLPFYQSFTNLFSHNGRHSELVDAIRQSVDDLTSGLLSSTDLTNKSSQQLDQMFAGRLRQLCLNATTSWYTACPVLFARSCSAYVDQTELAKIDKGIEAAGQWLTGLILPSIKGTTGSSQRTLPKLLCQQISNSACRAVDLVDYCSPDETFYGKAYHTFLSALDKLKASVVVQPWLQFNFTIFDNVQVVRITFDTDWVWLGRRFASLLIVFLALILLFRAFIQSVFFLRRYRTDFRVSTSPSCSWWTSAFRLKLLLKVLVFFLIEGSTKWMHGELQKIQFSVPEQGDARLDFNVQGNGTIATIMRSLLGGFSLQSKYCTKAESSLCATPFFPVGWTTWASLFSLALLYFLIGLCRHKSDYLLSRLCDRFIRDVRRKRDEAKRNIFREERLRRRFIIQTLAEEAFSVARSDENQLILKFYRPPKRWYHHRLTPFIVRSMMAYKKLGIDNISCQICFHDAISTWFRCKIVLFCDGCSVYLKRCPCGRENCQKREAISI